MFAIINRCSAVLLSLSCVVLCDPVFAQSVLEPPVEIRAPRNSSVGGHVHGIETENMFGFLSGSDTDEKGAKAVAVEIVGRSGKRDGNYHAVSKKLEIGYGVTDDLSMAVGFLASYHNIKNVTGFTDVQGLRFNGLGGELRYRFLSRPQHGWGLTLHLEPSWQRHDEVTGIEAVKWGSENKLILDKELLSGKLFGAVNLMHEMEKVREKGAGLTERGSVIGVGAALSYAVLPQTFVGGELRYLRSYDGLEMRAYTGDAVFVGPTLFSHVTEQFWISAAYGVQVYGQPRASTQSLNLDTFDRHHFRLKIGAHF